jgi:hypothetical protein
VLESRSEQVSYTRNRKGSRRPTSMPCESAGATSADVATSARAFHNQDSKEPRQQQSTAIVNGLYHMV